MNKKFSTLLASALLATTVGAYAQSQFNHVGFSTGNTEELVATKYYAIGFGASGISDYVGVSQNPATGAYQFAKIAKTSLTSLAEVDSMLWSVKTSTVDASGFTRFELVNKATGVVFAFDEDNAVVGSAAATTASKTIGGSTQWKWLDSRFGNDLVNAKPFTIDFHQGDSVMAVKENGGVLYAVKDSKKNSLTGLVFRILKPHTWVMSAVDLNTKGEDVKYMQLSFDADATDNNPFAEKYQAQGLDGANADPANFIVKISNWNQGWTVQSSEKDWLVLNKIGADGKLSNQYAHIDTSYFNGSGENFKAFNPIKNSTNTVVNAAGEITKMADNLPNDAFRFKFTKNLMTDSIKIETLSSFVELKDYKVPANRKGSAFTKWSLHTTSAKLYTTLASEKAVDAKDNTTYTVLSHIKLEGETEKVITFYSDDASRTDNLVNLYAYSNPIEADYVSIPAGVYKIKDVKTGYFYGVHIYTTDSVAEYTGAAAIDNMNFDHMPAFQWVVVKNDLSSEARAAVSPVAVTNREFDAKNNFPVEQLRKGSTDNALVVKFRGQEVEFIPVEADLSDKYLGYKNLTDAELEFTGYTFNYWHPYAQDRFINVNEKDTILNVLTTTPGRFTIDATPEVAYGYAPTLAAKAQIPALVQLARRSYTLNVKDASVYENKEGQFMLTEDAAATDTEASFFFKENNEFTKNADKVCYYALIAQNLNTKAGVRQNDEAALLLSEVLTEISTATFDIVKDNQPLYRRFNSALEGVEDGKDAPVYLKFQESYVGDYLMDETNKNFQREGMNYLGIGAKNIAKAGLSFYVRPFNIGKSAQYDVKPQYLIYVSDNLIPAVDTIPCDAKNHQHMDADGNPTDDPKKCSHAIPGTAAFNRYKLLVSFADSAANETSNTVSETQLYKFGKYTRVGFVDAVEQDSVIYVLGNVFAEVATKDLMMADVKKALEDKKISSIDLKAAVKEDKHHNYTWSFRYIDPANVDLTNAVEEERSFLIESNQYDGEAIAPQNAAWLKNQNNCLVLSDNQSDFEDAKVGEDNALIFNLEKGAEDNMATDNEEIATSEVTVIAGEGQLTIANAAGKKVVVSNILGQVVANTVLSSDNATIAAPQGVVVVAVEGEEAVKAIVK